MALPKFIITMDGYFRLGMVNQHKDLLKPEDQCVSLILVVPLLDMITIFGYKIGAKCFRYNM